MKKLAVIALSAALLLTGCSNTIDAMTGNGPTTPPEEVDTSRSLLPRFVELPDGRTLLCVVRVAGAAGGLSCDWDNAEQPTG